MKTIALAAAALAAIPSAAQAQSSNVPDMFWGTWATSARACQGGRGADLGRGQILVDEGGYTSDGERNAAILRFVRARGGRYTWDVVFSAVADRQWRGVMSMRRVGTRLGVTNGRNAERLYVKCRVG